jgi:predicted flap endonuclease-1-like 5' DNA nuclease
MTPTELRALLFLALVAVVGAGARMARAPAAPVVEPAAKRALAAQMAAVDSVRRLAESGATGKGRKIARKPKPRSGRSRQSDATETPRSERPRAAEKPPPPTFPIDVDVADSAALDALPGIGPALASRIVRERDKCGPYGSLRDLERVRGIGPAMTKRLAPVVTFSLSPRPSNAVHGCGAEPLPRSRSRRARSRS